MAANSGTHTVPSAATSSRRGPLWGSGSGWTRNSPLTGSSPINLPPASSVIQTVPSGPTRRPYGMLLPPSGSEGTDTSIVTGVASPEGSTNPSTSGSFVK